MRDKNSKANRGQKLAYQCQKLGNPTTSTTKSKKLVSAIASPSRNVEKEELRSSGLQRTLMESSVPMIPKTDTLINARPSM